MPMTMIRNCMLSRLITFWLILAIGLGALAPAHGQASPAGGITYKLCNPGVCFVSKADKEKHAKDNNCRFLEDICEKAPAAEDNKGATGDDSGIFGVLWSAVKSKLKYGYEFVKGIVAGLVEQGLDLWKMVTNIDEVVDGLVNLGKAFYKDPQGTTKALLEMMGQGAVDTVTQATQCGAYDLGKVVGNYVNPWFAFKLATKLNKLGKIPEARKDIEVEIGCASFAAGTMVLTPEGPVRIEEIAVGQSVYSRNERNFSDRAQAVTHTFHRTAPGYHVLNTDRGSFHVTDEHPLWVQGKGWTQVSRIVVDDVIAGEQGDLLVKSNSVVAQPIDVYNFSVANTANYFVGPGGMWAHNSACELRIDASNWKKLEPKERGFKAEFDIYTDLTKAGYQPVGPTGVFKGGMTDDTFKKWDGQQGIDGLYVKNGEYVIIESKAYGDGKPGSYNNGVGKLRVTKKTGRQMSETWIEARLDAMGVDATEKKKIMDGLANGKTKRIYAATDGNGTKYYEISEPTVQPDPKKPPKKVVHIGAEWKLPSP